MKSPLLLLFLLTAFLSTNAQFKLMGTVEDELGEAIGFATVMVIDSTSNHQLGTITDEWGQFELSMKSVGNYLLRISFVGYGDLDTMIVLDQTLDIGVQKLRLSTTMLSGVVVTDRRPVVEQIEDQLIFNVASSPLKDGYDGLEILQRTPHVWIDGNGVISMRQERATILINGRIVNWSGADLANYLSNLRSEDIERIEIQSNLSANVDAASSGGVINIILKKKAVGVLASLRNYYTLRGAGFFGGYSNLNVDYGKENWNLYGTYYFNRNTNEINNDNSIIYKTDQRLLTNQMLSIDSFQRQNFRLGGVFQLTDNQTVGAEVFGYAWQRFFDNNSQINISAQEQLIDTGTTQFQDTIHTNFYNATVNYTWQLDSLDSQLRFFADYSKQNSIRDNSTISDYDLQQYTSITERNLADANTDIFALQLDVDKHLQKDWKIAIGSKLTTIWRTNQLISEQLDDKVWRMNDRTTAFNYTERIFATYASAQKHLGEDYFLKVGVRLEQTDLDRLNALTQATTAQRYWTLVPSIYLSKAWIRNSTLAFSYAKRIQRPPFYLLNNNVRKINDFRFELGNPDLRPELVHRFELNWNIKRHHLAAYYHLTDEAINGIYFLEGETAFYKKFNEGKQTQVGLSYNYSGNLTDWWFLRASLDIYHRKYTNAEGEDSFERTTTRINLYQNLKLNTSTNLDIACYYVSPIADAFYVAAERYGIDLILQKFFFDKQLNCRIYFNDIFNTVVFASERDFPTFTTTARQKPRTQRLTLWMTYTFSNQQKINRRKNKRTNDASSRL
ncbi:MAG: outer membrane beta-barrel protein [Bacteroidota bacterium]